MEKSRTDRRRITAAALLLGVGLFVVLYSASVGWRAETHREGELSFPLESRSVPRNADAVDARLRRVVRNGSRIHVRVTGRIVDNTGKPVPHALVEVVVDVGDRRRSTPLALTAQARFQSRVAYDPGSTQTASLHVIGGGIVERSITLPSPLEGRVDLGDVVIAWRIPVIVQLSLARDLREALTMAHIRELELRITRYDPNPLHRPLLAVTKTTLEESSRFETTLSSHERISVLVRPVILGLVTYPTILAKGTFKPKSGVMSPITFRIGGADFLVGQVVDGNTEAPVYNAKVQLCDGDQTSLRSSDRSSPTGHFVLPRESGFDAVVAEYGDFQARAAVPSKPFVSVRFDFAGATRVRIIDERGTPIEACHLRPNLQLVPGSYSVPELPIHESGDVAVPVRNLKGKRWFLETAQGVCRVYWDRVLAGNPRYVRGMAFYDVTFHNEATGRLLLESSVRNRGPRYRSVGIRLIGDRPPGGSWSVRYSFRLLGDGPWEVGRLFPGTYSYLFRASRDSPEVKGEVVVPAYGRGRLVF